MQLLIKEEIQHPLSHGTILVEQARVHLWYQSILHIHHVARGVRVIHVAHVRYPQVNRHNSSPLLQGYT